MSVRSEWATPITWSSVRHLRAYPRVETLRIVVCHPQCWTRNAQYTVDKQTYFPLVKEELFCYYYSIITIDQEQIGNM